MWQLAATLAAMHQSAPLRHSLAAMHPASAVLRRRHRSAAMSYDLRDPAWQRDGILLLAYSGTATFVRTAATGVKRIDELGFDVPALSTSLALAWALSATWLLAALGTGVLGEERYDKSRLLLTWGLAAPAAAVLREALGASHELAYTDGVATLVLMAGVRWAEEEGVV